MFKPNKWITVTESDIKAYLATPQLELLRIWGKDITDPDPLQKIIKDTSVFIRGIVGSFIPLPPEELLIPDQLLLHCVFLVIEALHTRIPTLHLSEDQIRRVKYAHEYMNNLFNTYEKHNVQTKERNSLPSNNYFYGRSRLKRVSNDNLFSF